MVCLKIGTKYCFEFDAIDLDGDHLHLFVCAEPKDSPPRVRQIIKNITARKMFNNTLKSKKIFGSELWSKGGYIGTLGDGKTFNFIKTMLKIREINKKKII